MRQFLPGKVVEGGRKAVAYLNKKNYQRELEQVLDSLPDFRHTLLLHSCCAPCSSYVLEYLRRYFQITIYYYNPNISEKEEYSKRFEELKRLAACMNQNRSESENKIFIWEGEFEPECFFKAVKGLEQCPEGGERCTKCFRLRLRKTAELATEKAFDFFATTLTISPLKNAELLNRIGHEEAGSAVFLPSDFKKKDGYKRSIQLSEEFELYRQEYCGCIFSH